MKSSLDILLQLAQGPLLWACIRTLLASGMYHSDFQYSALGKYGTFLMPTFGLHPFMHFRYLIQIKTLALPFIIFLQLLTLFLKQD